MTNKTSILPIAAAALAASISTPASAQGARLEVHGAWDRVQNEGVNANGIAYGVGAGYDVKVASNLTLGAEVNADLSTSKKCESAVLAAGDKLCVKAGRDLSAVGRIGFEVAPRSLVYALAGYTNARASADYKPATGSMINTSANLDGFRVGAGFEQGLSSTAYSKVEYRYSNYEADTERHQILAGIGLRF